MKILGEFDYVVVGAGAAGCVLANRLSANGRYTVCIIEAGPADTSPFIHVPGGFIKLAYNNTYTWQFKTEPSEGTGGRSIPTTQGKTLGGSSSINGFNYTRGQAEDYKEWAALGNTGWGYSDVLPYFKRTEKRIGTADSRYRGTEGLLPITDCPWSHPLCDAFVDTAHNIGVPKNPDYNGASQAGAGYYQRWIHGRFRKSAARTFLKDASARKNLTVITELQVTGLIFDGDTATGVTGCYGKRRVDVQVRARNEVILSAGAANTPKLLMLSGLGPSEHLRTVGIPVRHDIPGVGKNLQDHHMIRYVCRVKGAPTLNEIARGASLLREIFRWTMGKPSILTISPSVCYAFWKSDPDLNRPDLQFHFSPGSYKEGVAGLLDDFPGMTLGFYNLRPKSVGTLRLRSKDPDADPIIQPNYMGHKEDQKTVLSALRLIRQMFNTAPLADFVEAEQYPPASATSDADLIEFAQSRGGTAWHLVSTCRMGPDSDPLAVVDDQLRVRGVRGLRIADASVMPTMPSGNTQIPTMMIAEKASDLILATAVQR